jgi:RNA polymerase sigma-70 factor (ECF subfamily)
MLKNRMDADDVTQEVLIKIWKNINTFKIASAKTWIMKTTHNLCIDYLRKRKINVKRIYSIDEEFVENLAGDGSDDNPQDKTHQNIMAGKVKEKIQLLPENLRSIFILYEMQGLKYREISKTLNIPINTVKVYLMRARKKLQEELKHYERQEVI